ncbi:hypothetical protein ANN_22483 [Periplaneta americana]|uniref:DDE-1 domain-containing protein n=1 Tax=Periplaneta americana TaxID=6978 RepID=A0ABQ8S8C0_PERAM|nr:hypothetical protein ANN_22483 [Periplaneta americana]
MDGSEKLPLLVIGKSANPRCFKNVRTKPVEYEANKKAWMTAHNNIPLLQNVKVFFFPPNMTSVVQPMNQGVIRNLKHFYRGLVVQKILSGIDTEEMVKIDLLDACRMIQNAWQKVTCDTVANCFRKAGFVHQRDESQPQQDSEDITPVEYWEDVGHDLPYETFVSFDDSLAVCGELTDEDILAEVRNKKAKNASSDEEEENQSKLPEISLPTSTEAIFHFRELKRFIEGHQNVHGSLFDALNKLEDFTVTQKINKKKQTKITSHLIKA